MITTKRMRELEELSEQNGVSKLELMENAGHAIVQFLGTNLLNKKVVIFCWHGNNGGDGMVAARLLSRLCNVTVLFLGQEDKLTKEAKENFEKIKNINRIEIVRYLADMKDWEYDIAIDAMLGTGSKGDLKEPLMSAVMKFNVMKGFKVSIDIPTGIDPDLGLGSNINCNPDKIITFHDVKPGLDKFMAKTVIAQIGLNLD